MLKEAVLVGLCATLCGLRVTLCYFLFHCYTESHRESTENH